MATTHPELNRLLEAIREAPPGPVLVLGVVDAGKTTLVQHLAASLAAEGPVEVADADPGQSWLGPPTMMAAARLDAPVADWDDLPAERLYFVGGTSPAVDPERMAGLVARLVEERAGGEARLLVDTPGLAIGSLAERFWGRVASRVRFVRVIAMQAEWELEPALLGFREAETTVVTCGLAPGARCRGTNERMSFREAAYHRYFRAAGMRYTHRGRLDVWSPGARPNGGLAHGRLVGLSGCGRDLGLGVVSILGPERVGVTTPLASLRDIETVGVTALAVDPQTGRETRLT